MARDATASARLGRRAGAARGDLVAAAVAGGPAEDVLLRAALRLAGPRIGIAALARHAAAAAGLRSCAVATHDLVAAAVAGRAAADVLLDAGLGGARAALG